MQRKISAPQHLPHCQEGAALLVFLLVTVITALSFLLNRLPSSRPANIDPTTAANLALAKEAVIGWSASHDKTPGMLPCPADESLIGTTNEGQAKSSCANGLPHIGRLPWRTLGLPRLRDASGEQLWYALSPGFRNDPINSDNPAQLSVDGISGSAVAIIFAAGPPLPGQNRPEPTATKAPDITQYLEDINSDTGSSSYVTKSSTTAFNDRLLIISARDLFSAVEKRVAREVRLGLLNFFCGVSNFTESGACIAAGGNRYFPRPADFNDSTCLGSGAIPLSNCKSGVSNNSGRVPANPGMDWEPPLSLLRGTIFSSPNWFQKNGWREHVFYAVANACIDGTSDCNGTGMLTVNRPPQPPSPHQSVVIIVGGSALSTTEPAQKRSTSLEKNTLANYLEDENLTTLDNIYLVQPTSPDTPFNDRLFSIP